MWAVSFRFLSYSFIVHVVIDLLRKKRKVIESTWDWKGAMKFSTSPALTNAKLRRRALERAAPETKKEQFLKLNTSVGSGKNRFSHWDEEEIFRFLAELKRTKHLSLYFSWIRPRIVNITKIYWHRLNSRLYILGKPSINYLILSSFQMDSADQQGREAHVQGSNHSRCNKRW